MSECPPVRSELIRPVGKLTKRTLPKTLLNVLFAYDHTHFFFVRQFQPSPLKIFTTKIIFFSILSYNDFY